jgi:DNA polymerase III subunit epsilon
MIDWIKNIIKEYPEFWKNYVSKFDEKCNRFVVLSIETDGLDALNCTIKSIGAVAVVDNNIVISDSFEITTIENQAIAIEEFMNYLGNAILIGYHVNNDIEILNFALEKIQCGRLKNEAFDVEIMQKKLTLSNDKSYEMDELLKFYNLTKSDRYYASDEAFTIAMLFLKLKVRLKL